MDILTKKSLRIFVFIVSPIIFISIVLISTGTVSIMYNGFAVDTQGKLYIGKENKIEVYEENKLIYSINPQTSRGYVFTIKNERIILSTASTVYIMELNGTIVDYYPDEGTAEYNRISRINKIIVDGKEYNKINTLGRISIVCNDEKVIYKMPILDYLVEISLFLSGVSIFIFVPIFVLKNVKLDHKFF